MKHLTIRQSPESVLRQQLLLLDTCRRLPLHRRTEEQTGSLHRLEQMTQVPPMRRVPIVLNIPTLRRIRQPVLETHLLHDIRLSQRLSPLSPLRLVQFLTTTLRSPRHRDKRMHLPVHNADNCGARVKAGRHGAAGGLDGSNGRGGGARDDDVDGLFEGALAAAAEELHTFFGLVNAAGLGEFADGNGAGWVYAALVDPFLDAVEVCGG